MNRSLDADADTSSRQPIARRAAQRWLATGVWGAAGLADFVCVNQALESRSATASTVIAVTLWLGFAIGLVATLVPSPLGLTIVRLLAPLTVVVAVASWVMGADLAAGAGALAITVVATLAILGASLGETFVQGSAYGDERRLPLRPPAAFLLPLAIVWVLWTCAVVAAVGMLASGRPLWGFGLAVVAICSGWLVATRAHRLSRRWLVLVPSGVVIHDAVVLGETLMMSRPTIRNAQLALADTEAADLTGPAAGHAVQLTLSELATVVFAPTRAAPQGTAIHAKSLLIAPTRPGRALAAAADFGYAVG